MALTLVAAMNKVGTIGKEGVLPWRDPLELKHFREVTAGKKLVMGRRTFESLPSLSSFRDRSFLVVTRQEGYELPRGVTGEVVTSPEACLPHAQEEEVMVAGGELIYEALLPHASTMLLSLMPGFEEGDTHFPAYPRGQWKLLYRVNHPTFQVDHLRRRP